MTSPKRHWRSYGDQPLPSDAEALDEPFRAFPSWFLRIACDRCGKAELLTGVEGVSSRPVRRRVLREG